MAQKMSLDMDEFVGTGVNFMTNSEDNVDESIWNMVLNI